MSTDDDMRERHGRVLAELAETGMVMVRRLSAAMLATDDVQTQAQLGLAYHRVSRAVRQTMALEFRLAQEARREDPAPVRPRQAQAAEPAAQAPPRERAERADWNEYERDDSDEALDALDEQLEADELDVAAVHDAIEASMARIRHDIAADPILAKAGVLAPSGPAPGPRTRRSDLMGGGAPTLSFPTQWKRGTARRAAGEERVVERASPIHRVNERPVHPPSLRLTLSTIGSSADGPPLPLRGKGSP